ncbi:hypothetical protein M2321_001983 [Rhodoblastus acidophilus]|nr:hypothetical protein [Rhodoblastus acidophilus]
MMGVFDFRAVIASEAKQSTKCLARNAGRGARVETDREAQSPGGLLRFARNDEPRPIGSNASPGSGAGGKR